MTDEELIRRGDVRKAILEYLEETGSELERWDIDQIVSGIAAEDHIEELVEERDLWKSRYEHHNHERLETLKLNAMQASKIGSLMNTIAKLEKKISKLEKTK